MKMKMVPASVILLALCSSAGLFAGPPEIPPTPAAVAEVLYAQPFTLEKPYNTPWQAEQPEVKGGMILVLQVDPGLVFPRQSLEPVLYVGNHTAERVNVGFESGRVVAIVPAAVNLAKDLVWFGDPELPERVTAAMIKQQRTEAETAGLKPFTTAKVEEAMRTGGEPFRAADQDALRRHAAELILRFAPDEKERAEGILAPRVTE